MSIFQRTSEIVSANLNDFVDRFERPDRMLRHALREMETLLAATSFAVAKSLAAERLLSNARDAESRQVETWSGRAKSALDGDDEALARRAIARQLDHRRSLASLENQLARTRDANASLRRQIDLLRDKHAAAHGRLAVLVAGQAAAEARRQVCASTSGEFGSSRTAARFEHFCRKLELAEAEAVAWVDLETMGEDSLEQEIAERETQAAIEDELLKIKNDS